MFYNHKIILLLFLIFVHSTIYPNGFIEGTLVKTKDTYITIELIKVNDLVLSYNFDSNNIEESKVKSVKINHSSDYISLISNNTKITVSPYHKFYCPMNKKRWTLAKDIKSGDYILRNVRELIKIDQVLSTKSSSKFYCLSIEKNHNYFVSNQDILVHNFAATIPLFTWVIGEGITWVKGGTVLAAAGAWILSKIFQDEDIDCSGLTNIGDVKVNFNNKIENKKNHILRGKQGIKHGFIGCPNGDDPEDKWWERIQKAIKSYNTNSLPEGQRDKINIPQYSNPNFGDLVIEIFKARGVIELSTAYLKQL